MNVMGKRKERFLCLCLSALLCGNAPMFGKGLRHVSPEDTWQTETFDSRVRSYVSPVRILWKSSSDADIIENESVLLQKGIGQSVLGSNNVCRMKNSAGEKAAILFDFGKELQGGVQIITGQYPVNKPIRVRIRFGESVGEAMSEIDGKNGAGNEHAMRDFETLLPWLGVTELGNSGFRFLRIDLLDENIELQLKEVRAISVFRNIPYAGSFRSNDERLNKIWETGAYTVHLNMQEYLWDGIKRDRLVWVGDLHPEVMTVNTVFGYNDVVPKSLDLIRDETQLPGWMNGMSSYSIWWLLIHRDWYYYQGDRRYLEEQRDYICRLLQFLMSKVDEEGREHLDGTRFLDWPSSENPQAINAGLHALMAMAMQAGEELCAILGEESLAKECKKTGALLSKHGKDVVKTFRKTMGDPAAPGNKQAAALLTLSGLMSPEKANKDVLLRDGAAGFSTFYGYYMLKAMAEGGYYEDAMNVIRSYWGGMIDLGATTFWEDFNTAWLENAGRIDELLPQGKIDVHREYGDYCYKGYRHSLCHGWASGPTSWLSEYVLGVKVVEPGCKKIRISPHLGDLEWVEGSFPTPYGTIKMRHEKGKDGKIYSKIDAPDEIEIVK